MIRFGNQPINPPSYSSYDKLNNINKTPDVFDFNRQNLFMNKTVVNNNFVLFLVCLFVYTDSDPDNKLRLEDNLLDILAELNLCDLNILLHNRQVQLI